MLTGYKILVAEDNPLNQKVTSFLLQKLGAISTVVADGSIAVKLVESDEFDLILMDLHMPEMDGYEATEYIRKTLNRDLPVVALSATSFEEEKQRCLDAGMNACITKPLDAEKLTETILRLTKEKKVLPG